LPFNLGTRREVDKRQQMETWIRTVQGQRQKMGFTTWSEAVTAARDRKG